MEESGICRQAYHGGSFVGNHVHKFIKVTDRDPCKQDHDVMDVKPSLMSRHIVKSRESID